MMAIQGSSCSAGIGPLLLVAAASLFAYNQAQQGNDWRPIVTQVGLAFSIVIAIDVITFIFVGNGTGTTSAIR